MQSLCNGRVSVRPSVCPIDRHPPLVAAWARAADVDWQLPAPRAGCRSISAAGARAAAAGSVMLRAEVRGGSTRTCWLACCHVALRVVRFKQVHLAAITASLLRTASKPFSYAVQISCISLLINLIASRRWVCWNAPSAWSSITRLTVTAFGATTAEHLEGSSRAPLRWIPIPFLFLLRPFPVSTHVSPIP